ncbi:MAG: hypothetical protein JWP51_3412 [Bradyrhizobium sp.]|nr:hypothetical protein [Bradyrhizobium sp.]
MKARANEPNPPRVTPPEPESDEMPEGERLDEESPLKKLLRDDEPPDPPDEELRGGHPAPVCKSAAVPG